METNKYKKDFPIFANHKGLVYLDSAATSQKPRAVIEAEKDWYEKYNANIHRGAYRLAEKATALYEHSRQAVADFLGASDKHSIIFTKGTTESINLVASAWGLKNLKAGDVILLTEMEHHANLVPWQMAAERTKAQLRFWPINETGELIMENLDELFSGVKILALTQASNVLGTINPVKKIIKLAQAKNIPVLIDAAQSVGHWVVDVKKLNPDWLVFSSHKILGPSGLGVLYVKPERFNEMDTYQTGGDIIEKVAYTKTTFKKMSGKYEAGTQPLAQVYALAATLEYLKKIGLKNIERHGQELTRYAYQKLSQIPQVKIIGPGPAKRGALISFTVQEIHPHDLATLLDRDDIAIRAGHHCAQPLHHKLNLAASARVSFHLYNSKTDIDKFINSLTKIIRQWQRYINKK